jgi:hypothetical protein
MDGKSRRMQKENPTWRSYREANATRVKVSQSSNQSRIHGPSLGPAIRSCRLPKSTRDVILSSEHPAASTVAATDKLTRPEKQHIGDSRLDR